MNYFSYLSHTIDTAMIAACGNYSNDKNKRDGSLLGLELCKGRTLAELKSLHNDATFYREQAQKERHSEYWYFRAFEAEIAWIYSRMLAFSRTFNLDEKLK